jgi:hypothetical protein
MATTTPNFGWPVPTSTDLVKDGATAIEALGDGIDTSMVDLKGGTTGQILAKATNADMDFAWVTNDVGDITAITASSPLTGGGTSGDVTIGILSGTTSNLGAVQLSTSTTSTSTSLAATSSAVKAAYDPAFTNNFYSGKNKVINGDTSVWARGTSFTLTNESYTADRFKTQTDKTGTISRQAFTAGAAPVAGYEGQYYLRSALNAVGSYYILNQPIENVQTFADQTVTLSFWARVSSGTASNAPEIIQNFGSGGSGSVTTTPSGQTITTSWQRFTVSVSIPSITGKTIGTGSSLELRILRFVSASAATIDLWGVQLEAGSTATPFQTATGTIQGELAACQRYYWRSTASAAYSRLTNSGFGQSATAITVPLVNPVEMRTAATTLDYGGTVGAYDGTNITTCTAVTLDGSSSPKISVIAGTVASGLTQYRPYGFIANNSSTAYIGLSAEL